MKREILFRAKRKDNDQWIYGDILTFNGTGCEISDWDTIDYSRYDVNSETIGQFTGIKDKSGLKIFEGDIIKVDAYGIASVIFNTAMASFMILTKSKYNDGTNIHIGFEETEEDEIEVVGNIHDNPKLITE